MTKANRVLFKKVFICYSRIDSKQAERLYLLLKAAGYDVFLDKYSIHPGDEWEPKTLSALREANFVIILLSQESVKLKGYAVKEYSIVLDFLARASNVRMLAIPLKLDSCMPPEEMMRFQWTDFSPVGTERMLEAMKRQREAWIETDFPPAEQEPEHPLRRLMKIAVSLALFAIIVIVVYFLSSNHNGVVPVKSEVSYQTIIADAITRKPLQGAFAYVLHANGDTLIKSNASGTDGRVYFRLDTAGHLTVTIHFAHPQFIADSKIFDLPRVVPDDTVWLQQRQPGNVSRGHFTVRGLTFSTTEKKMFFDSTGFEWKSDSENIFSFTTDPQAVRCIDKQGCRFAGSAVSMVTDGCTINTGLYLSADDGIARGQNEVLSSVSKRLQVLLSASRKKIIHIILQCLSGACC